MAQAGHPCLGTQRSMMMVVVLMQRGREVSLGLGTLQLRQEPHGPFCCPSVW